MTKRKRAGWSARARNDLYEIANYIANDDPLAALRWVEAIEEAAERVANFPHVSRVVPEIGKDTVRETFHGKYRIIFVLHADAVQIITVFQGNKLISSDVVTESD